MCGAHHTGHKIVKTLATLYLRKQQFGLCFGSAKQSNEAYDHFDEIVSRNIRIIRYTHTNNENEWRTTDILI